MDRHTERVRVMLPNGTEMWAEAQAVGSKEVPVSGYDDLKTALSLDFLRGSIEGMGTLARSAMEKVKPSEVSIEFGLELAVDNGQITALWVKGSAKANLKVTLSWKGLDSSTA